MKVVIQNSAIKGNHEFHVKLHKYLEMLILAAPILLLTWVILKVLYWGRKKIMNKKNLKWLFEWWPYLISHHPHHHP